MEKDEIKISTATSLPTEGMVRLRQIIGYTDKKTGVKVPGVFPFGKTKWWKGVKAGLYPQPIKESPRCTVWKVEDIRALIKRIGGTDGGNN